MRGRVREGASDGTWLQELIRRAANSVRKVTARAQGRRMMPAPIFHSSPLIFLREHGVLCEIVLIPAQYSRAARKNAPRLLALFNLRIDLCFDVLFRSRIRLWLRFRFDQDLHTPVQQLVFFSVGKRERSMFT